MTIAKKPVSRETYASLFERGKNRPIVITIEPSGRIGFRLKGTRRTYYLTAAKCYVAAVSAEVEDQKRLKAAERKAKAKERKHK